MRILLVEDNEELARHVARSFQRAAHECVLAYDGPSAVKLSGEQPFDIVVLDVNLPGFDGFEVLRRIRALPPVQPRVIMLTARSGINDRVSGLKAGADDYLTKPFALEELMARIDALGRRGGLEEASGKSITLGALQMDTEKRRVTCNGARVELSPREFEVLQIFMREPGRTFSRDEICERIWEREHEYDTRTVEIFIMRLRKKLDPERVKNVIETVRGVGYVMHADA